MAHILVAAAVCGAIGSILSAAALIFAYNRGGKYFLIVSLLCGAIGIMCVVASLQSRVATLFTCVCMVVTVGVGLCLS